MSKKAKLTVYNINQAKAAIEKFNKKIENVDFILQAYQPKKLDLEQEFKKIDKMTRRDFNNYLNKLQRYSKKGAEELYSNKQGLIITKWEQREFTIDLVQVNRDRKRELEKYGPTTYKGTMGTIERNNLRPLKYKLDLMTENNFLPRKKSLEKQRKENYIETKYDDFKYKYIGALERNFDGADNVLEFKNYIEGLESKDMYESTYNGNYMLGIDYLYDNYDDEEAYVRIEEKIDTIIEAWKNFIEYKKLKEKEEKDKKNKENVELYELL